MGSWGVVSRCGARWIALVPALNPFDTSNPFDISMICPKKFVLSDFFLLVSNLAVYHNSHFMSV